ncbi:MAG: cytochrome c oxidase assembly protein [Gammaproteobacteria bacterium]|nr:cytochrome c oxidase assembly protein [Gammaproteobacteria bacterium]
MRIMRSIAPSDNAKLLTKLLVIVVAMFAFGYALIPIYRALCEALGINVLAKAEWMDQKSGNSSQTGPWLNTQVDTSRNIAVEFDANDGIKWKLRADQSLIKIHPGELTTVYYEFTNLQDKVVKVQAIPSYAPQYAGNFFQKIECFCFRQHSIPAKGTIRWPVVFFVDKKLPEDMKVLTLSYTIFELPM